MKRKNKDTINKKENNINKKRKQKYQELIQNKKVQVVGMLVVICSVSLNLASTKSNQLNLIPSNINPIVSMEKLKAPEQNLNEVQLDEHGQNLDNEPEFQLDTKDNLTLYALSACLMDASNGRVLYGKDEFKELPMASTTKIMTLLMVLENANLDEIVTVSTNAAKQPDVQLNIRSGEKYCLRDLLYSLMLESHNDTAVAIAEHVGGSVELFCDMMTTKAIELGALNTSFKTPNGLDEEGHYTTARDLSLIASYAVKNPEFCKIVKTQTYQFNEVSGKRSFSVNNKDRFLYMMDGAIGIKTGFTGKAGYCFVGAIKLNGKVFVSTVLGAGWPPHKEYKWSDTKKLMKYGLSNYEPVYLLDHIVEGEADKLPEQIAVLDGKVKGVKIQMQEDISKEKMLLSNTEKVTTSLMLEGYIEAPLVAGTTVGMMNYYINHKLFQSIPIITCEEVEKVDFGYVLEKVFDVFL
jgi:D-alanyl-D-alanine carboxypeptidase (penicillin-binding protein 5/6)